MPRPAPRGRSLAQVLLAGSLLARSLSAHPALAQSPAASPAPAPAGLRSLTPSPAPAQRASPSRAPAALPGLEDLPVRPAWMGIRAAPGVNVQEVTPGGPAERAGLKAGDVITGVDGKPTFEEPGLMGALREKSPGDSLLLEILRSGVDLEVTLTLGEFPADLLEERRKTWEEEERRRLAKAPDSKWPPPLPSLPPSGSSPSMPAMPAPPPNPAMPDYPGMPDPSAVMWHAGQEERAFLGVTLQELSSGLAVYLGLPADSAGVLVEQVHEGSPAALAGLEAGDVVLSVGGETLRDMTQLGDLLRQRLPGDEISLQWWSRNGADQSAVVTLGARNKEIWVLSPPDRERKRMIDGVRESLEARLRILEEQRRRLALEQEEVARSLKELKQQAKP